MDNNIRGILVIEENKFRGDGELANAMISHFTDSISVNASLNFKRNRATYIFFESNYVDVGDFRSLLSQENLIEYTHDSRKYAEEELDDVDRCDFDNEEDFSDAVEQQEDYLDWLDTGVSDGAVQLIIYNLEDKTFETYISNTDTGGEPFVDEEGYSVSLEEFHAGYGDDVVTSKFVYDSFALDAVLPDNREEVLRLVESLIVD